MFQAIKLLGLPAASEVLVPTYHCPTIVAPVVCAGMRPRFFAIRGDGLPDLESIDLRAARPRAIIAAHYFGLPRSMAELRQWCDHNDIALIEDCAHSYFGRAGERPVGGWGDYAAASVSKFFPVPEAGVLLCNAAAMPRLDLERRDLVAQIKGFADVVELGALHGRFGVLNPPLRAILRWKNRNNGADGADGAEQASTTAEQMLARCDMARLDKAPLAVARLLVEHLPRGRIIALRRRNFAQFLEHFRDVPGARPLARSLPDDCAPYVFPLWVDDADRVYRALRAVAAPVFRWDRIWPATPSLETDHGRLWSTHVLQLLCHQDLDADAIAHVAGTIQRLLNQRLAATPDERVERP